MNFIQHIQEIDKRIEDRKEEEYQKILFDFEDDTESVFGLGISHTSPMVNGGIMYYKDGMPQSYSQPAVNGGMIQYNMDGTIRGGLPGPKVNGGRVRYSLYKVPKPSLGGR